MLRNFFLVTIRNLWRNKSFSTINILGLAIGMGAALLIGLWVQNEHSYDSFYTDAGRTYELVRAAGRGHEIPTDWFLQDIRD